MGAPFSAATPVMGFVMPIFIVADEEFAAVVFADAQALNSIGTMTSVGNNRRISLVFFKISLLC
jgi:hypothetical protein